MGIHAAGDGDLTQPNQLAPDQFTQAFYPALYRRTDDAAKRFQKAYIWAIAIEVFLTILGGLAVVLTQDPQINQPLNSLVGVQVFGGTILPLSVATALALLLTVLTVLVRYIWQPGEHWRESRFVGERGASLAWRYGVKATDYDMGSGSVTYPSVQKWYTTQISELLTAVSKLNLPDKGGNQEITDLMTQMRGLKLAERYALYRDLRAQNQRDWYDRKVKVFTSKRDLWRLLLVLSYVAGFLLLLAHATGLRAAVPFGLLDANYWPLVVAVTGSISTWVASRHYEDLVQSYKYVRDRLQLELDSMKGFLTEPGFAEDAAHEGAFTRWVDHIEILMDAEHQQWHAMA